MIKKLIKTRRVSLSIFLFFVAIFCLALTVFRQNRMNDSMYFFLNWNLFLAFIPWALTSIMVLFPKTQKPYVLILLFPIWLLFFPNTIYILTDIIHLRFTNYRIIWYDLFMVLSFASTGLLLGLISLFDVKKILSKYFNPKLINLVMIAIMFLSSFGVYLGRFLRWNSWDIVNNPFSMIYDIAHIIIFPFKHQTTWMVTILLGVLLNIIFWTIKLIKDES